MTEEGFHGSYASARLPQYCSACGHPLQLVRPHGEERERHWCAACGRIHYVNPTPVAAVLPVHEGRVLLLRRAIAPRAGTWVFPGGFIEWGETAEQAAVREAREEAGIDVTLAGVIGVYSRPGPGVIIAVWQGAVAVPSARPGPEASEVVWFSPEDIPWDDLAFDTTEQALRDWVARRDR